MDIIWSAATAVWQHQSLQKYQCCCLQRHCRSLSQRHSCTLQSQNQLPSWSLTREFFISDCCWRVQSEYMLLKQQWTLVDIWLMSNASIPTISRTHWTPFSKFFSSFPHGTCLLSVSCQYLAVDEIYHQLWVAIQNNPTRWRKRTEIGCIQRTVTFFGVPFKES